MKHVLRHWRTSGAVIGSLLKKGIIAVLALLVVFLAGRIYESQRGPAASLAYLAWQRDDGQEIDQATFAQYLAREKTIFADLQREVTEALPEEDKTSQPLLSPQPGLAGTVYAGLEPLFCYCRRANRAAAWCCSMA
jgi:hypothetical protein